MKAIILAALTMAMSVTSMAEQCHRVIKSNILVSKSDKETQALTLDKELDGSIAFKSCEIAQKTRSEIHVKNCETIGRSLGYTAQELIKIQESINKNKSKQRLSKTGLFLGISLAGPVAGAALGFVVAGGASGLYGGHGMETLGIAIYTLAGAQLGVFAGPICGGATLLIKKWTNYKNQTTAFNKALSLQSENGIMFSEESTAKVIADLKLALQ